MRREEAHGLGLHFDVATVLVEEATLVDEFSIIGFVGSAVEAVEYGAETASPKLFKYLVFFFLHNCFSIHALYGFSRDLEHWK